jgi:transcription elongation GreA/GreB family factor
MLRTTKLLMIAALIALLQACGGDDKGSAEQAIAKLDTNTPDGALMATIAALKQNDIKSLMQASMSAAEYDEAVAEFEKAKKEPSESDKAQFAQTMQMLTADGAEDQLMAMVGPQLEQARQQLPMMLMMGKSMAAQAIESSADVPANQKESAVKVVNALMDFVSENDVLSEEVTRKAISAAISTAKELNMNSLDDLQSMSFDDAMGKASIAMNGVKNMIGAYGISLDDVLNSIEVSDVQTAGDSATMKLAYEFLGQSFDQDIKMVKKDGKWTADK